MIRQKKTEALIIDSLGLAAGTTSGDPSGPALSFMDTLRKLGKAAFVLGHIPKGLLGEENKSRRVYGSVFFTNLARNVFELRSTRLPDLHEISAALFHRKTNDAWLAQKPLGLRIKFADMVEGSARRIVFEPDKNFRDKPQLAQGLPLKERLRLLLQHFQPLTPSSLSKEAHVSTTAIRDMLNNEKEAFIVVGQLGKEHLWGLRSSEEGLPSDEEA